MIKKTIKTAASVVVVLAAAVIALKIFGVIASVAVSAAMVVGAIVIVKKLVK